MIESTGIIATIMVFISFIPNNVYAIRIFNLIGSIFFVVYGFGIGAIWTGILNFGLIFVQAYHLYKLNKAKDGKTK